MNQECLDAQRVVSETYDGEVVDPAAIQRARQHCSECPECAAFVSTLAAIRKAGTPSAPPRVVQNAIETVRAEVIAQAALAEEAAAAAATAAATTAAGASGGMVREFPATGEAPDKRLTHSPWFAWGGWAAAAAVVVVLVGALALRGIDYIASPGEESDDKAAITQNDAAAPPVSAEPESLGAAGDSRSAASAAYITVGGLVYRHTGPATAPPSNVATVGTTVTALDTASAPQQYSVVSIGEDQIAIVTEETSYAFELVVRQLRGQRFAMQSRPVSGFGQWPSLPDGYAEPTEDDGGPTFSREGSDDSGVTVFTPNGADPTAGFAIAPNTSASDPAAGNPNWTWWVPVD